MTIGETLGWHMKAYVLTQATVSRSLAERGFIFRNSIEMFSVLKAIEIIRTVVDRIKAPIPNGAALKTSLRSGRKFSRAKTPIMISLNTI